MSLLGTFVFFFNEKRYGTCTAFITLLCTTDIIIFTYTIFITISELKMFCTLHGRWIGYVFKEHGSFPYYIAQNLTVRRICLGHSIPSVIHVTV